MHNCKNCNYEIDGRTDDYYNLSHTTLTCPNCGWSHHVSELEDNDKEAEEDA